MKKLSTSADLASREVHTEDYYGKYDDSNHPLA